MRNCREKIAHGNNRFPIAAYRSTPSHIRYQMAFHWHPEQEILYVLRGALRLTLGQRSFVARAGDVFFIQGGSFHAGVASEACEYHCFAFNLGGLIPEGNINGDIEHSLSNNAALVEPSIGNFPDFYYGQCTTLSELLLAGQADKRPEDAMLATACIFGIVGRLFREKRYRPLSQPSAGGGFS
ncbi:MAG: cupin domain-containing protein [Eubacteriales bacterium]